MGDFFEQKALETHLQTRGAPQHRTTGQRLSLLFGDIASKLRGKPKKGAINYTITNGQLAGQGEGFVGTFSTSDIGKFDFNQVKDAATQLGLPVTGEIETRRAILDAIRASR